MVLVANVGCDQVSKTIARNTLSNAPISFVHDHITLIKVQNPGAFLSLGSDLPFFLKIVLLNVLPLAILALAGIYVLTKANLSRLTTLATCFVIGGGLGNLYDRMVYGSVTDFLHIKFGIFQTGIFNLADVSIMIGALVIVFEAIRYREPQAG